jgi:predicted PurR-regulated permease PerM
MFSSNGLRILASILVIILILIAVYISRFFIGTVVLSILFAYMLYPIYEMALGKIRSDKTASLLAISTIFLAAILVILVFYRSIMIGSSGISESAYHAIDQANSTIGANGLQSLKPTPNLTNFSGNEEIKTIIQGGILPFVASFVIPALVRSAVDAWIFPALQPVLLNFALILPIFIAQIIIAAFFAYYLLITGKRAVEGFTDLFSGSQRNVIQYFFQELNGTLKRLFTTNFDVAAYNALVGMIIFSCMCLAHQNHHL